MTAAFYCVADPRYFLGAVGLINSLRLVGHREPIFVLDLGLDDTQRRALEPEATLVRGRRGAPPWLQKTKLPLEHPAEAMVLIDADMIVTRPLAELIERARAGQIVAFRNDTDRFVERWGELLELGHQRREPYISSGLVFLAGGLGADVLELLDDRQARVDVEATFAYRAEADYPFLFPEQDLLNAILSTRVAEERVARLPNRLAPNPPYRGLRLRDPLSLQCAHRDGTRPFVLHQFGRKPWLEPTYHGIYPRLLARLLLGDDVAIRVAPEQVPRRMRSGPAAALERGAANVYDIGRWYLAERLPRWVRRRAASLVAGREAGSG